MNTNFMRQPDMGLDSMPREFYVISADIYVPIYNIAELPETNGLQYEFVLAASKKYSDPNYKITNETKASTDTVNSPKDDDIAYAHSSNQISTTFVLLAVCFVVSLI